MMNTTTQQAQTDLLVLGGGPGGYTAAFRAADLGLKVTLVEQYKTLGGVCLNVGCIPSKTLLHSAKVMDEVLELANHGIEFGAPTIQLDRLRGGKDKVIDKLCGGLAALARQREVEVITGEGRFTGPHELAVEGQADIHFDQAVIAVGSRPKSLPFLPDDPRIMSSTGALSLEDIPRRLLVVGGGIIGLEMATVYAALGSNVTIVEASDNLILGCDSDLVEPLKKRISLRYEAVMLGTTVQAVEAKPEGLSVSFKGVGAPGPQLYDRLLISVGRQPNGALIDAQKAGVKVDDLGFIGCDEQQRSNVPHIFSIGDVAGAPMLAHKAAHEGKIAAEVAAGRAVINDAKAIPAVAYTDPEIAWVGLTEAEALQRGIAIEKASFPWQASGRAQTLGRDEGLTKILVDSASGELVGVGIVGPNAGDLIAEAALAIEVGCEPGDVALTVHPHPTLSETFAFAAEAYEGTLTELYLGKEKNA